MPAGIGYPAPAQQVSVLPAENPNVPSTEPIQLAAMRLSEIAALLRDLNAMLDGLAVDRQDNLIEKLVELIRGNEKKAKKEAEKRTRDQRGVGG